MDRQKFEDQTFVIVHKGLECGRGATVWEGNWLGGCAGGTRLSASIKTIVLWL